MKKLLILISAITLLSACGSNSDLENKQIEKISFDMNNKCTTIMKKDIPKSLCDEESRCVITEIFYSPKTKSCLFV